MVEQSKMTRIVEVRGDNCTHKIDLDHQLSSGDFAANCPTCGCNYQALQRKYEKVSANFWLLPHVFTEEQMVRANQAAAKAAQKKPNRCNWCDSEFYTLDCPNCKATA